MQVNFKSRKLKSSIVKVTEKVKDNFSLYKNYTVYGVTKDEGISITGNITSEDLSEYIVVGANMFAFNPYRVNIGSIGISGNGFNGLVSPAYVVFVTKKDLLPEFLFYFLKSDIGIKLINWYGNRGGVRNALRFDDLGEIDIPDLSIEEQEKALKRIGKANISVSFLSKEIKTQQTYLQQLRQSILQEAVQGRLTQRHKDDEPASKLLERIKAERQFINKLKELNYTKVDDNEKLFELPKGWAWCRIGEVTDCLDHIRIPIKKEFRTKGNIPYYGANGQVGWIDKYLFDESLVLVVEDETFEGRVKPFSYVIRGKAWVNNHAHVLRPLGNISVDFLDILLCKYDFVPLTSGTTGRKKLTKQGLLTAPIPLPPLHEQRRIETKVQQLLQIVKKLEEQVQQSQVQAQQLLQSVLKEAFSNKAKENHEDKLQTTNEYKERSLESQAFFRKIVLAAHIVYELCNENTFGHTKLMKLLYLCEEAGNMQLLTNYKKFAAGPFDKKTLVSVDAYFKKHNWFQIGEELFDGGKRTKYILTEKSNKYKEYFNRYFVNEMEIINNLIFLLRKANTDKCSVIATLYYSWKEIKERKQLVNESSLVTEFYKFHEEKRKFTQEQIIAEINWMKEFGIHPVN